ncbi:MAG: hypothetical protein Q4F80_05370 [bacterium]|nr:hypothetical protein [bacterium]
MHGESLYIAILNSNLINFLIMTGILVWVFKKFKLGQVIDSITDDIKNNVVTSAEAVQNAINEYRKTKKESRNINVKKEEIIDNAKEIIRKLEEKNSDEIVKKETELDKNAEKLKVSVLDRKIQKTTEDIELAIYKLSVETIQNMMDLNLQKKIIIDSLDEFDRIEGVLR